MSLSLYSRLAMRFDSERVLMSRRSLIKGAALLAASGVLASVSRGQPAGNAAGTGGGGRTKKVVIIGAGFSGLACALELVARGHEVVVLEGRGRVGGRVLTMRDLTENGSVEAGGEWIGANHPTWLGLAEKFNLNLAESPEEADHYSPLHIGGKILSAKQTEDLYNEMSTCLESMNKDAEAIDATAPWNAANAADLDRKSVGDWLAVQECSDLCRRALNAQISNDNGVPIAWQSYLAHLAMVKGGGVQDYWENSEVFRCRQGNQELATRMYMDLTPERFLLSNPAKRVEWSEDGKSARVIDSRGAKHECDHVVVAVAPTVWKNIEFAPTLPQSLRVQMGLASKMLCTMKTPVWNKLGLSAEALSDSDIGYTWESTGIHPAARQQVLCAFSGGPGAEIGIRLDEAERNDEYKTLLGRIYTGIADEIESMRYIGWPTDRWTMAGYAFPAPGQVTTTSRALTEGLGNGAVQFAGEHTSLAFAGYMEGALSSGTAAAQRIDGK
jgi:monoamine oxidase